MVIKSNNKGSKKASIELSTNFIVVAVISIVLIGIGITLTMQGKEAFEGVQENINEQHKQNIIDAMSRSGNLVMIYPNTATISRGDYVDFTLGINNELLTDEGFGIVIIPDASNPTNNNAILYRQDEVTIKKDEFDFSPIRIIISKDATPKVSYIYNVCVYSTKDNNNGDCGAGQFKYGSLQKIIINVR